MSAHTPTYKELIKEAMDQNGYHDQKSDTLWREGVLFGAQWQSEQTQSELESLRAERDGLVEALRLGRNELERAKMSLIQFGFSETSSTVESINNALTILTKHDSI